MSEIGQLLHEEYPGLSRQRLRELYASGCPPSRLIELVASEFPHANHGSIQFLFMDAFGLSFPQARLAAHWLAQDHGGVAEATLNSRLAQAIDERRPSW